jgi:CHASE2 domain-containing sensor protein
MELDATEDAMTVLVTSYVELDATEDTDAEVLIVAIGDGSINELLTKSELATEDEATEDAMAVLVVSYAELETTLEAMAVLATSYTELETTEVADVEALIVAIEDGSINVLLTRSELDTATDDALMATEAELELSVGRAT